MKKMNLLVVMLLIISLISTTTVYAGSKAPKITVTVNQKTVHYNVKPYMKGKNVMTPAKETSEALGAKVEWDKKTNTEWINLGMMHIELPVGKSEFYIHRDADFSGIPETVKLSTAITKVKNVVFVSGNQLYTSLGAKASWNSKKRLLSLIKDPSTNFDLSEPISYTELSPDDIAKLKDVSSWYQENNQKQGIFYKKYDKSIYVLIGAGSRPTGGYNVNIDNISYKSYDTVSINARVTPPGDNVRVMMIITYPSLLIKLDAGHIKKVTGEVIDADQTTGKEQWITLDSDNVTKMVLYDLDQTKLRDITGTEANDIMKSFNEAEIDPNPFIEMIAGSILKVTVKDGTMLTFTSYGSKTNVVVSFEKDGETRTFHLIAPVIAQTLLNQ